MALSSEMKEMQKRLHQNEGFRTLQETLLEQTRGGGDSPKVQDPALLAAALEKATSLKPSPALLEEVAAIACQGGGTWSYSTLADSLWDDEIAGRPMTQALDKGGRPKKHLFLPLAATGFYNDNVEPRPSLFGIKKGSSSVRYNLFNNEYGKALNKTVAPELLAAVDRDMKVVPASHPTTLRPLDPVMAYLYLQQGKRCGDRGEVHQEMPMDILKHTQRHSDAVEWQSLPTYSFSFTKAQSGSFYGCERRNQLF
mmetsp:Transcript_45578/g.108293  ORF Transcript_45578/g.108293 Transcript_45578/m.108293 type:complete len:254 (+) Transcript_45578:3-764(+)